MNSLKLRFVVALVVALVAVSGAKGVTKDVEALLKAMPGDVAISVVVPNAIEFDARLKRAIQQFGPSADSPGLVSELSENVKLGAWVDFSKPVGLAQRTLSDGDSVLIFGFVPDFAEKVQTITGAKEKDGLWQLPFDAGTTVFAAAKGSFVVAGKNQQDVNSALSAERSLGENVGPRVALLEGRHLFAEMNFDPLRPTALGGIMQLTALAPMLTMSAGADPSVNPAAIAGVVTTATDGLRKLVEQLEFVDLALGIENTSLKLTIQPTFKEGAIHHYLANRPNGTKFFEGGETDGYMLALSWHFPGESSPFFDYMFSKMEEAAATLSPMMQAQQPSGADPKSAANAKQKEIKESLAAAHKLYTNTQGISAVFSSSPSGMRVTGDYSGPSPAELLRLLEQSLESANPIANFFGGGLAYQASGSRQIGGVEVKEFAVTLDPNQPPTAKAAAFYGTDARLAMGIVGDRVRYCLGSEEVTNKYFAKPGGRTLDPGLATLLKQLPREKNVVLAVNPGKIIGMLGPLFGGVGDAAKTAPTGGPPIGLSISLSGQARLDLHVPLTSIKPLLGDGGSGGPM